MEHTPQAAPPWRRQWLPYPSMRRINHLEAYSDGQACTNQAESFFARLRRAELGHHHHIAGRYLIRYAQEAAWREDNRRVDNSSQVRRVALLGLNRKPSVDFCGYWERHLHHKWCRNCL